MTKQADLPRKEGESPHGHHAPTNATIFMKGVSTSTDRQAILDAFSEFGDIKAVRCRPSRGFGFVEFRRREGLLAAVAKGTLQMNGGDVAIEECKTQKQRRKRKGNGKQEVTMDSSNKPIGPTPRTESPNKDERTAPGKKKKKKAHKNRKPRAPAAKIEIEETGNVRDDAVARALAEHKMTPTFPQGIEDAARALCVPPSDDLEDRTSWPYVTIDGDTSVDLDQAMFIEKLDNATNPSEAFLVSYALADGAHFVPPHSDLFEHALHHRGGSSFYLPGLCVPMLPRCLSEDCMSLNEKVLRQSLVFDTILDAEGRVLRTSVARARIRNVAKLSYKGVQEYYDSLPTSNARPKTTGSGAGGGAEEEEEEDAAADPSSPPNPTLHKITDPGATEIRRTLDNLKIVGNLRRALARERQVVEYKRRSCRVVLNAEGRVEVLRERQLKVELYNEQISLLCNVEGARLLQEQVKASGAAHPVRAIFRLQNAPTPESVAGVRASIAAIARAHRLDAATWEWGARGQGSETLASFLRRVYAASKGRPRLKCVFLALQRAAMISNKPALFDKVSGQHWSLKAEQYARFSSPMRELAGCFTHSELAQSMGWAPHTGDAALRDQVITAANKAKRTQRDLGKQVMLALIDQVWAHELCVPVAERKVHAGAIVGVDTGRNPKVYVMLHQPPLEVKVYLEDLGDYSVSDDGVSLCAAPRTTPSGNAVPLPTYRIGDRVGLRLSRVEPGKGRAQGKVFKFSMWLPREGCEEDGACEFAVLFDDV